MFKMDTSVQIEGSFLTNLSDNEALKSVFNLSTLCKGSTTTESIQQSFAFVEPCENSAAGKQRRKSRYVPHDQRTPDSVNKRNQRERTRTERLGSAFKKLQSHIPSLRGAPKRVSKEKIIKNAMEYIHELTNLLKEHGVSQRVHAETSRKGSSKALSTFSQSNNFSMPGTVRNPEVNSTLTFSNGNFEFQQQNGKAELANSSYLLERYLNTGTQNGDNNTSNEQNFQFNSRSIISENDLLYNTLPLSQKDNQRTFETCCEEKYSYETVKPFADKMVMSPISRVSPSPRMAPRSLVKDFNSSTDTNVFHTDDFNVCELSPQSPSHSVSSSSSSILSHEDIDQLLNNVSFTQLDDAMTYSDAISSAPSSPSSSISGVHSFTSDEEELDFVLETACDIMSEEHLL